MSSRWFGRCAGCVLLSLALETASHRASSGTQVESLPVDSVLARAARAFEGSDLALRQRSLEELRRATVEQPSRADAWLASGRAHLEMGQFSAARSALARATSLTPDDAGAWRSLGLAWRLDWLCSAERESLDRAQEAYARACRLAPERPEDWTMLAALLIVRGHPREAIVAGLSGRTADPDAAGPWLALGAALFRAGDVALADSAFARGMRYLPEPIRWRLEDPHVLHATPAAEPDSAGTSSEHAMAAWAAVDPDLTTPENEALLDFRARAAIAVFLFSERGEVRWDMRAELFARYGPPSGIDYNPAGSQVGWDTNLEFVFPRSRGKYPYNLQVWHYDELGMSVRLWDRSLVHRYELPYSENRDLDPRPDPSMLVNRADVVMLGGGRGVFRVLPPGTRPLRLAAAVSRFPQAEGTRVLAHVFAPGTPLDSLRGAWALATPGGRILARGTQPLGPAACDPAQERVAEFSALLPPGEYRVDLTVGGARGQRGIRRLVVRVPEAPPGLAMSDIVLTCAPPGVAVGTGGVRIEPDLSRRLSGTRDATVYYELEHLRTGPDGVARFAYTYSVRPLDPEDPEGTRHAVVFEATREESTVGAHRRKFVTIPVAKLGPGTYELLMRVRDLTSNQTVARSIQFSRT